MKPFPTFAEAKNDLLLDELELRLFASSPLRPPLPPRRSTARLGLPPLTLGGSSSPHFGPTALWSSSVACWLRGGGVSWPRSQEWSRWPVGLPGQLSGWYSLTILLQPVDWHHPHVARVVRGCLGPSPHHLSAGLLCRSTVNGALGSSLASAGAPSTPGVYDPSRVGALD
jgi:hypothetical protein